MKITQAHFVAGYSSFYFDDQQAIKKGAGQDGFVYIGQAVTDGFREIRQAGECVSVLLVLDNGAVAVGDCAAVQYSGAGGRDPLFLGANFVPFLEKHIKPLLEGRTVNSFLANRGKGFGLRLGVRTSGCSGMAYVLEFVDEPAAEDTVFEDKGVKVVIDGKSLQFLDGTQLDFVKEGLNEGFKFTNPNVKDECGCGESFHV